MSPTADRATLVVNVSITLGHLNTAPSEVADLSRDKRAPVKQNLHCALGHTHHFKMPEVVGGLISHLWLFLGEHITNQCH